QAGGLFIKFFNEYAVFPTSGLRFCMNQNMIVLYMAGRRIMPGWMQMKAQCGKNIHLEPHVKSNLNGVHTNNLTQAEIWKPENVSEKDAAAATEMAYFVAWVENEIRISPTQWCWDYRKWSRRPFIQI
ncbi:MAG: hypothetical protein V4591_01760, partial [Bdellovibrionota bacterium]